MTRPVSIIVDREKAIQTALSLTKNETDAVIIAGKGADAYQIIQGKHADYLGDLEIAKKHLI